MTKASSEKSTSNSNRQGTWIARDAKSGRFVEVSSVARQPAAVRESSHAGSTKHERRPGRFKGVLTVGPEFFEPLSESDLAALGGA